jgi:hypothetical protein
LQESVSLITYIKSFHHRERFVPLWGSFRSIMVERKLPHNGMI